MKQPHKLFHKLENWQTTIVSSFISNQYKGAFCALDEHTCLLFCFFHVKRFFSVQIKTLSKLFPFTCICWNDL